jgi:hypothetical protein
LPFRAARHLDFEARDIGMPAIERVELDVEPGRQGLLAVRPHREPVEQEAPTQGAAGGIGALDVALQMQLDVDPARLLGEPELGGEARHAAASNPLTRNRAGRRLSVRAGSRRLPA